ncbi:MAG: M28 family peptidase, partial [bacterium]|nr:M28 family peptidase [bacterium]
GSNISDKDSTRPFSGPNAFAYVKAQTDIGTRVPGSEGSKAAQKLITDKLSVMGWNVCKQSFNAKTPLGDKNFTNIIASKGTGPAIVLGAHYDTKFFKDFTFLGANDGASGTALLLEMADILAAHPLKHRVEIVFFDGEESFGEWSDEDSLYGSRHYVAEAAKNKDDILAAIIVDMVGDKNLQITYELNSHPELREMLFKKAEDIGVKQFCREQTMPVDDDHIPFLLAGIPAIDIIGFGYTDNGIYPSYWHTAEDTIDKVSPESLEAVGKVLLALIRDLDNVFK